MYLLHWIVPHQGYYAEGFYDNSKSLALRVYSRWVGLPI